MIPAVVDFEQNRKININFTKVGVMTNFGEEMRRNNEKTLELPAKQKTPYLKNNSSHSRNRIRPWEQLHSVKKEIFFSDGEAWARTAS